MQEETAGRRGRLSRRQLLRYGGGAGVALAAPLGLQGCFGGDDGDDAPTDTRQPSSSLMPEVLSEDHAQTLDAALARLIPSDDTGAGAREAKVWRFIDRSLGADNKMLKPVYEQGLSALAELAQGEHGKSFRELSGDEQDALLQRVEGDEADGFEPGSAAFFGMLWEHALEGMFGDPLYGGNDKFVGWDLIGFTGIKLFIPAGE
ncbi:MAG TPA: gluconate 2-dehydrogenase subunit 3 family protein, partial [Solirubrobacteraceae bacterium]|nr:gluconate 2-dehydrogenase subunit 3 family protein [Solirubrobacteraceae bacterium]